MKIGFRTIMAAFAVVFCLSVAVFAQRTTGDIEGTVTDPNGAAVPGVNVMVTGKTVGFARTVQSNAQGVFRVVQIPAGDYKITAAATGGFAAAIVDDVTVTIENTTTANIKLGVAAASETVVVTSDQLGVNIDTTDSKVQTNITSKLIEQLPKGTSLTSVLRASPATRGESLSGGFQVDGASGSENSFVVDGLSVENYRTGTLNGVNNIPLALVQDIQIKTGGFEAEHGGASGGVVSVATKSGTDKFRFDVGSEFDVSGLQPRGRAAMSRFVGQNNCTGFANCAAAFAANPDYTYLLRPNKDKFANIYPTGTFSGPLIKNRLWFLGAYSPQMFRTTRVSNFYNALTNANFSTGTLVLAPRVTGGVTQVPLTYKQNIKSEYAFGRLDGAIFNSLRGSATYLWNPEITDGNLPFGTITTSIPVNTTYAGTSYPSEQYARLQGGRVNSNNVTGQVVWTPTSKLVATFRYGRAFQNQKGGNYALANEPRYVCGGAASAYDLYQTGCARGFANLSTNSITSYDVSVRNEFNGDVSYLVNSFGGRHEFKGGYQFGKTINTVLGGNAGTGTVSLNYGQDYISSGISVSLPCVIGSDACIGVGTLSRAGAKGEARNRYQAIYVQDRWQPITRLSLNLGMRLEKENLPSYNEGFALAGSPIPPIRLGWGKKIAPRLGGAYDAFGDGKTKIYGNYSWFYDRLKFELPRGLFGGNFQRVDYFPITKANPNYAYYTPQRILGTWTDPLGGGNPSTAGGLSQLQRDQRIPSNLSVAQFTALGLPVTGVDPDLKAFRQSEITVGVERELSRSFVLTARFTRKNVDHAIEDHAILGLNESENYPIGNPGEGLDLKLDKQTGYVKSAKPRREYKALELTLTKRFSNNYTFSANYTYGRLYGNYSGLASSDEGGRTSPAVNRFFDYAINGFTASGEADNGFLATDRRHAFKAFGTYTFTRWGSQAHATDLNAFFTGLQGTPQTTFVTIGATSIPLVRRGDLGRTPVLTQTDLALTHRYKIKERYEMSFVFNVLNAFNQNTVTSYVTTKYRVTNAIASTDIDPTYRADTQTLTNVLNKVLNGQIGPQIAGLASGANPSISGTTATAGRPNPVSSLYGQPSGYQGLRNVRFGFRFRF